MTLRAAVYRRHVCDRGFIVGAEKKFYPFIYLYGFSTLARLN